MCGFFFCLFSFFFQAEDGIRDLVRSRGLGDVYKRQALTVSASSTAQKGSFALRVNQLAKNDLVVSLDKNLSLIHI